MRSSARARSSASCERISASGVRTRSHCSRHPSKSPANHARIAWEKVARPAGRGLGSCSAITAPHPGNGGRPGTPSQCSATCFAAVSVIPSAVRRLAAQQVVRPRVGQVKAESVCGADPARERCEDEARPREPSATMALSTIRTRCTIDLLFPKTRWTGRARRQRLKIEPLEQLPARGRHATKSWPFGAVKSAAASPRSQRAGAYRSAPGSGAPRASRPPT